MRRALCLAALAVLAACGAPDVTEPTLDLPLAEAPKDNAKKGQVTLPAAAAFAILSPDGETVCLAIANDTPGNGDFRTLEDDDGDGVFFLLRQSSTTTDATISLFTADAYFDPAGTPFLVAEGYAREKQGPRSQPDRHGASVFHAHARTDDGGRIDCMVVYPDGVTDPNAVPHRRVTWR